MRERGVFRVERLGHVEAVEPHLVGITLLVPEAARGVSRLVSELIVKKGGGGEIALVLRDAIKKEKLAAEENVVELMLFRLERWNRAIGRDEGIDRVLDVAEVAGIGGVQPNRVEAFEEGAELVVPDPGSSGRNEPAIGPAGDRGIGGKLGPGKFIVWCSGAEHERGGGGCECEKTGKNTEGLHKDSDAGGTQ